MDETLPNSLPPVPAPCICNKVGIIYRLINNFYAGAFEGMDITNEQVGLLLILSKRGEISQNELGKALGMEKSTISRNLKHLAEKGWVKLEKIPGKKAVMAGISVSGTRKVALVLPHWRQKQVQAERLLGQTTINELDRIILTLKNELK